MKRMIRDIKMQIKMEFSREIRESDCIILGSFEAQLYDRAVRFDFVKSKSRIEGNVLNAVFSGVNVDQYPDMKSVSAYDVDCFTEISDLFVYLGREDESLGLQPTDLLSMAFKVDNSIVIIAPCVLETAHVTYAHG